MSNMKDIVDKFFHGIVKPADFTYQWGIVRHKNIDWDSVDKELQESGLGKKIEKIVNAEAFSTDDPETIRTRTEYRAVEAKHTSKHWQYRLVRVCRNKDMIVKALAKLSKRAYAEVLQSKNYSVMKDKNVFESKKCREFSSLSSMQKWVDKHNIKLDVYKLWQKPKRDSKKTCACNG